MSERGRVARFLGRWLTALVADGCELRVNIFGVDNDRAILFGGKWSSTPEPITTELVPVGSGVQRVSHYDIQKVAGIHEVTLQPGDGDSVALAIRERGVASAYAYYSERIYAIPDGRTFPEHPEAEMPPGSYAVRMQARAGEVQSPWMTLDLTVEDDDESLSLGEAREWWTPTPWPRRVYRMVSSRARSSWSAIARLWRSSSNSE